MLLGGWLVLGLILVPVVFAIICLFYRNGSSPRIAVIVAVVAIWTMVVLLASLMIVDDVSFFGVPIEDVQFLDLVVLALDLCLATILSYIGIKRKSWPIIILAIITLVISLYLETLHISDGPLGPVTVDRLSLLMLLITNLVGGFICIFAIRYMEHDRSQGRFFALMLLFLAAMNGAVISSSMVWLFLFWEVTTFCSFALIAHERTEKALKAADRALMITLGGAVCFGMAMVLIAWSASDLNFLSLNGDLQLIPFLALPLLMIAAFTKSAQLPFQSWLVGAMEAPTPVSALLHSATMVNLGVYLLIRTWSWYSTSEALSTMLLLVGGLTFLASSILALRQSNAKRILAYSTIGTLGLIFVSLGLVSWYGLAAAYILLVSHAVAKAILFLSVGAIKHESGSQDVEDMEGLRMARPFLAYSIYLGVFLMLIPPFGVFTGKLIVIEALIDHPWVLFLIAIGLAATVVYYGKWLGRTLVERKDRSLTTEASTSRWFSFPLIMLILMGIGVVILTVPFLQVFMSGGYGDHIWMTYWPIGTPWTELSLDGGSIPTYALLALLGLLTVLSLRGIRHRPEESTGAYACGETMDVDTAGQYLYSEKIENNMRHLFELLGLALIMILMVAPYLLEEWSL